ncbi:hypothetical protein V2J09_020138 [Rumex salicifolius]
MKLSTNVSFFFYQNKSEFFVWFVKNESLWSLVFHIQPKPLTRSSPFFVLTPPPLTLPNHRQLDRRFRLRIKMRRSSIALVCALSAVWQLSLTLGSTVPAFMWSPHVDMSHAVNYQTISPKDLAKSVLSEGGWSELLCAGKTSQQPMDIALVFVGKELQSADVTANTFSETGLVNLIKASFTSSNSSMAFPYVAVTNGIGKVEKSLLAEFEESCENGMGVGNVIFTGSCSADNNGYKKVAELDSIYDHLIANGDEETRGVRNLVVYCHDEDQPRSESDVLTQVIRSVHQAGLKYTVLYVSDPYKSAEYPSRLEINRFLAEGSSGNSSSNSTCDGVCQIKTSLLEGLFTGLVLLIILISGLCCMMGIDTPTRFEAPQDS